MKMLLPGLFIALATITISPASAAVVLSDTFEGEALGTPQTTFSNFTVESGSVDVVGSGDIFGLPCAGGSSRCVDLDGSTNAGGTIISTNSFAYAANSLVSLSFDLAGSQRGDTNPFSAGFRFGGTTDVLQFTPGGGFGAVPPSNGLGLSQVQAFGTVGSAFPYTNFTISFRTNAAGSLRPFFATASSDNIGPLLDNVNLSIGAVPEPATWAFMIAGFGAVGGVMRLRRRQQVRARIGHA